MRQRKTWTRTLGLTAAFTLVFTSGVYAQDIIQKVDAYLRPDFNIVRDGKPVNLAHSTLVYEGSSYLPLKEIGTLFGATINWKDDTKTIYINTRHSDQQPPTKDDLQYQDITMLAATPILFDYLGAKTWVLQAYTLGPTYYRDDDIKRMGINTNGISKVRDKYTGWLFVSEEELSKVWKEKPTQTYDMDWLQTYMTTETDPDKMKTFEHYAKISEKQEVDNEVHYIVPIVVDPVPGKTNAYRMLVTDNGHYFFYDLQLQPRFGGGYLVNTASRINLETGKDENEQKYPEPESPFQ